jgi:CheY-like chemotaxis protein
MDKTDKVNYSTDVAKRKKFNILIVDDDIQVADSLKEYLTLRGHKVQIVEEGSTIICNLNKNKYDIIFLDYHLDADGSPSCVNKNNLNYSMMDGSVLMECIKEINNNKSQLIFAYTGDTSKSAIDKFKQAGMDGVIFKPIEEHILNRLMTSLETQTGIDKIFLGKLIRQYKNSILVFS